MLLQFVTIFFFSKFLLNNNLFSYDLCKSLVRVRKTLENIYEAKKSTNNITQLQSLGIKLFYRFVEIHTESSNHFPPTKPFIISVLSGLAEHFIMKNSDQVFSLLKVILQSPQTRTQLLIPYFLPSNDPGHIMEMYKVIFFILKIKKK